MIISEPYWQRATLPASATVEQAISNLNAVGVKIVLVVGINGALEGTVSDGDIRRGLLRGVTLNSSIDCILQRNPLVATPEMDLDLVKQLMVANKIQQIPVVNEQNFLVGLHLWDAIAASPLRANLMVIMAGGEGVRLRPYTENCPKPLLKVSGRPILEHIIERAKLDGFNHFLIAINYLGNMIEAYFGDGSKQGVRIEYLRETNPLGTAGALGLLESYPEDPFIVTNGDIITDIRYGEMIDFHVRNTAVATMAVRLHEWQNPFGVVQTQGIDIIGFDEKPINRTYINAGVYVLNSSILSLINSGLSCDMPALFEYAKNKSMRTIAYPMHEPWLDVGRPDDYLAANKI